MSCEPLFSYTSPEVPSFLTSLCAILARLIFVINSRSARLVEALLKLPIAQAVRNGLFEEPVRGAAFITRYCNLRFMILSIGVRHFVPTGRHRILTFVRISPFQGSSGSYLANHRAFCSTPICRGDFSAAPWSCGHPEEPQAREDLRICLILQIRRFFTQFMLSQMKRILRFEMTVSRDDSIQGDSI